jgi:hypothetical protein
MTNDTRNEFDDLLGDLRRTLDVEPSPEFEARVRERVATETAARTGWWWMGAAAAVAATVVIIMMVMPRSGAVDDLATVQTKQVERVAAPVELAASTEHVSTASKRPVARAAAKRRTTRAIVPPGQDRALQQLVAAVWSGHVKSAPRVGEDAAQLEIGTLAVPEPIQMSTIRIDPLYEEF